MSRTLVIVVWCYALAVTVVGGMLLGPDRLGSIGILILVVAGGAFVVLAFANQKVFSPLRALHASFVGIGERVFGKSLQSPGSGDWKEWAQQLEALANKLDSSANGVSLAIGKLAQAGEEIRGAAQAMSSNAQSQTGQAQMAAASMETMTTSISETSASAAVALGSVGEASAKMSEVMAVTNDAAESIRQTHAATRHLAEMVERMRQSADGVTSVVSVIKEIADQTNLLALNAAIEAARAGEHGRGFAVVADEVRKLANNTVTATNDIGRQIKAIQSDVKATADVMATAGVEIAAAHDKLERSSADTREINDKIGAISAQIEQISMSLEEQSAVSDMLRNATTEVSTAATATEEQAQQIFQLLDSMVNTIDALKQTGASQ